MSIWDQQQTAELGYWKSQNLKAIRRQLSFILRYFFRLPFSYFEPYTVLEVGTGPVGFVSLFKAKTKYGVEPLLKEFDKIFELPKDVKFFGCKAEHIPIKDDVVDIVLCFNVIPTHVDNTDKCLKEIYRVMKSGGLFIFGMKDDKEDQFHRHVLSRTVMQEKIASYFTIIRTIDKYRMFGVFGKKEANNL